MIVSRLYIILHKLRTSQQADRFQRLLDRLLKSGSLKESEYYRISGYTAGFQFAVMMGQCGAYDDSKAS